MVGFTSSLAVLATLGAYTVSGTVIQRSKTPQKFILKTSVDPGSHPKFNGLSVQEFHTGAGENAVVGVRKATKSELPHFYLQDKKILWQPNSSASDPPYGLYLDHGLYAGDSAPKEFYSVQLNFDQASTGFVIDPDTHSVGVAGNTDELSTFAICNVTEVSDNDHVGPDYQLLWKNFANSAKTSEGCHDVDLIAEYV